MVLLADECLVWSVRIIFSQITLKTIFKYFKQLREFLVFGNLRSPDFKYFENASIFWVKNYIIGLQKITFTHNTWSDSFFTIEKLPLIHSIIYKMASNLGNFGEWSCWRLSRSNQPIRLFDKLRFGMQKRRNVEKLRQEFLLLKRKPHFHLVFKLLTSLRNNNVKMIFIQVYFW